jgi:hypothetical protein
LPNGGLLCRQAPHNRRLAQRSATGSLAQTAAKADALLAYPRFDGRLSMPAASVERGASANGSRRWERLNFFSKEMPDNDQQFRRPNRFCHYRIEGAVFN